MIVLLGISSLASLVAALVLGTRLLRLATRTRGVPELALGVSFLIGGFLGLLFVLIGNLGAPSEGLPAGAADLLFRVGMTLLSIGMSCTFVFVWQTFRPESALARILTVVGIGCILVSLWPVWTTPVEVALATPMHHFGEVLRLSGMLWGSIEAFRYYTAMRRRLALGLADPVVTNRFLLWAIAMAAGVSVIGVSAYMSASGLVNPNAWPYLALAILTAISPVAQWLAFFPPRSYLGWITSRAPEAY